MTVLTLVNKKELLPCPFCGSSNIKVPTEYDMYISCNNCLSYGPSPIVAKLAHSRSNIVKIIDLWNLRYGR